MARETYRGARRNAEFGRKPKGNTWPRLARVNWQRERGRVGRKLSPLKDSN